jgi:hypothetical protein
MPPRDSRTTPSICHWPLVIGHWPNPIQRLVADFLGKDPQGRDLVIKSVNEALKPAADRVSQTLMKNRDHLVMEFEPPEQVETSAKATSRELAEALQPIKVAAIEASHRSVILTGTIGGQITYDRGAFLNYVHEFDRAYGKAFRHVAILYAGEPNVMLAMVPSKEFAETLNRQPREVIQLLNSGKSISADEARQQLVRLFGNDSIRAVHIDWTVQKVLNDPSLWPRPADLDEEVAVVDSKGQLTALTTRRRLIEGAMGYTVQ